MSRVLAYQRRPPVAECTGFVPGAGRRWAFCDLCGARRHAHVSEPVQGSSGVNPPPRALRWDVVGDRACLGGSCTVAGPLPDPLTGAACSAAPATPPPATPAGLDGSPPRPSGPPRVAGC